MLLYSDHSFNDEKNTSVLTISIEYIISTKCFDAPLFQNLHIYLSMCSLSLVFFHEIAWSVLFSFVFSIVIIVAFRIFVKWFILLDFSFFSFYNYLCICHQPAKICSKFYNWILFKLIFLYLIDFGADFSWLIPRYTKRYSSCIKT